MRTRYFKVSGLLLSLSFLLGLLLFGMVVMKGIRPQHLNPLLRPTTLTPDSSRSAVLSDFRMTYHLSYQKFQAEFPFLQSYKCRMLADRKGLCQRTGARPLFLLAIKSQPSSFQRRAALRQIWVTEWEVSGYLVRWVFLMATSPKKPHMNLVEEEIKHHRDILLWDFVESHHNLSLKERCFLEWLYHNCREAQFIFKGDDDEFINPKALVRYVTETANASHAIHGSIQTNSITMRYGKYQVSEPLFPYKLYPYFPSGGGFIMPRAAIPALYNASLWLPVFPLDDVYFGFLALAANLTYHHDDRFYVTGLHYTRCRFRDALVVHDVSPESQLLIWQDLQQDFHCDSSVPGLLLLILFLLTISLCAVLCCFGLRQDMSTKPGSIVRPAKALPSLGPAV
ncbi:beta-1,3-galactosyltransferase 5-like [Rhinatrema bivittatum]|uniref:beta-1,3-galactosyltransferase 5-like n=1 Tax=Rhinatrema bivittatum TaxID=194408 RepID=UPI00112B5A02|nr:beta-1,3-galactosyltransferase 5-like [Rhinatrema bivittatum]XP_029437133.1 beta-1,3-galactosyltransferase 5-like [Rhinatrema bivittatum]XP_029437134.1 beta-1,3-galactosyltransferase 5-like [Rhinatrema bivittatum]